MEKRIELEKRGRRPNQIVELNLDNCRSTSIVGLTDEFTALETLSLINVGLTTLKGFPNLPNLKKLELSDNRISNGLNYLTTSPKLTHLNLSGNRLKDLDTLKPLEGFRNLEVLDLFNNEATSTENYREKIFALIPSLKYLDGFDANEIEASSDGEDDEEANGNDSDDDDEIVEDEDCDDDDDDDGSDDENEEDDISLAMVYNEDLEEGNSEWEGEHDDEEDDDDEDSEEENGHENENASANENDNASAENVEKAKATNVEKAKATNAEKANANAEKANAKAEKANDKDDAEADEAANQKDADMTPEQSEARGKKRKHDG